jgi:hypothetical protein
MTFTHFINSITWVAAIGLRCTEQLDFKEEVSVDHRQGMILYKAYLSFIIHEIVCSPKVTPSSGFDTEVNLKDHELVSS